MGALLALAACSSEDGSARQPQATNEAADSAVQPSPAPANVRAQIGLAVSEDGLHLYNRATDKTEILRFGSPREAVMDALAFKGPGTTNHLDECGAGPLDAADWPDGLTLYFQDDKLAGWATGPRRDGRDEPAAVVTTKGIGPGSAQAELESRYRVKIFDSTLGTEFDAGSVFGILDGTGSGAKVTNMWAGVSCNMR